MKLSFKSPISDPDDYLHTYNCFYLALSERRVIFRHIASLGLITRNSFDDTRRGSPPSGT